MPDSESVQHPISAAGIRYVQHAARVILAGGTDPMSIDLDALLATLAQVAHWRADQGEESRIVQALVELAARALLWAQSVDDLADVVGNLPAVDDDQVDRFLAQLDDEIAWRRAGTERKGR